MLGLLVRRCMAASAMTPLPTLTPPAPLVQTRRGGEHTAAAMRRGRRLLSARAGDNNPLHETAVLLRQLHSKPSTGMRESELTQLHVHVFALLRDHAEKLFLAKGAAVQFLEYFDRLVGQAPRGLPFDKVPTLLISLVQVRAALQRLATPQAHKWLAHDSVEAVERTLAALLFEQTTLHEPLSGLASLLAYANSSNRAGVELPAWFIDQLTTVAERHLFSRHASSSSSNQRNNGRTLLAAYVELLAVALNRQPLSPRISQELIERMRRELDTAPAQALLLLLGGGSRLGLFRRDDELRQRLFKRLTAVGDQLQARDLYKCLQSLAVSKEGGALPLPERLCAVVTTQLRRGADRLYVEQAADVLPLLRTLDVPVDDELESIIVEHSCRGPHAASQPELHSYLHGLLADEQTITARDAVQAVQHARSLTRTGLTRSSFELLAQLLERAVASAEVQAEGNSATDLVCLLRAVYELVDDQLVPGHWLRQTRCWHALQAPLQAASPAALATVELPLLSWLLTTLLLPNSRLTRHQKLTAALLDGLAVQLHSGDATLETVRRLCVDLVNAGLAPLPVDLHAGLLRAMAALHDQLTVDLLLDIVASLAPLHLALPDTLRRVYLEFVERNIASFTVDQLCDVYAVLQPSRGSPGRAVCSLAEHLCHVCAASPPPPAKLAAKLLHYLLGFEPSIEVAAAPLDRAVDALAALLPSVSEQTGAKLEQYRARRHGDSAPAATAQSPPVEQPAGLSFRVALQHYGTAGQILSEYRRQFRQAGGSRNADALACLQRTGLLADTLVRTPAVEDDAQFLFSQLDEHLAASPSQLPLVGPTLALFNRHAWLFALPAVAACWRNVFAALLARGTPASQLLAVCAAVGLPLDHDALDSIMSGLLSEPMAPRQAADCLAYLARLSAAHAAADLQPVVAHLWRCLGAQPRKLSGKLIGQAVWATSKLPRVLHTDDVLVLAPQIAAAADTFNAQNLANFWYGLGEMGIYPGDDVFDALAARTIDLYPAMNAHTQSNLLRSWIKIGVPPDEPRFVRLRTKER